MRTAIFTARNNTTLTIEIETDEVVDLVQMGGQRIPFARLSKGRTAVEGVPAGVFKLVSKGDVQVTPDAMDVQVATAITPDNKGDWPDLTLTQTAQAMGADPTAVRAFLVDAKSRPDPK